MTTKVYVNHEGSRMTPTDTVSSIDTHIEMIKYNIKTLQSHYSKHPKALSHYYENIGSSYLRTYLMNNENQRLVAARSYFLKAFFLWPTRLKTAFKYLFILFPSFYKSYIKNYVSKIEG